MHQHAEPSSVMESAARCLAPTPIGFWTFAVLAGWGACQANLS